MTHPSAQLWAEVVRIAYHLHWPLETLLDLEHPTRRRLLGELDALSAAGRGGAR